MGSCSRQHFHTTGSSRTRKTMFFLDEGNHANTPFFLPGCGPDRIRSHDPDRFSRRANEGIDYAKFGTRRNASRSHPARDKADKKISKRNIPMPKVPVPDDIAEQDNDLAEAERRRRSQFLQLASPCVAISEFSSRVSKAFDDIELLPRHVLVILLNPKLAWVRPD